MPRNRIITQFGMIAVLFGLLYLPTPPEQAGTDYEYTFEHVVDNGVHRAVFYHEAPDGSGRRFVVDQLGRIYVQQPDDPATTLFMDIYDKVSTRRWEQGMLGMAFHPDFADNGYFYINYVDHEDDVNIARFSISAEDPNQADPDSEMLILKIVEPFTDHNGGMLSFGPDGYLYIGVGDGGSANDPDNNGQNSHTLLGAILRIDVDHPAAGQMYGIPKDNPFADGVDGAPEVWMYGLRNPWRFSFDTATGDLYIGDVGQNTVEEVNFAEAGQSGLNFGWSDYEGSQVFKEPGAAVEYSFPIAEYTHDEGCSVTGGYVYRGTALPELVGTYFYADFCLGKIWTLKRNEAGEWDNALFMDTDFIISSFGQDLNGELYINDHNPDSGVFKLVRRE